MEFILSVMLPFWISIGLLSLVQGAIVAIPAAVELPKLNGLRSRLWATIPALSVIGFVVITRIITALSTQGLTYLALGAVPILAAITLGWLARGARPWLVPVAAMLFVLAWVDRSGLAGQGAALVLCALSCAGLGVLLASVTPAQWLMVGIVLMAVADTALVVSDLLQAPNNALNVAHPPVGLPSLQRAVFGSAVMGYGDLFVAGVFGGMLAAQGPRSNQLTGAALVALLAVCFDLMFFVVSELPATVPVAFATILLACFGRRLRRPLRSKQSVVRIE